MILPICCLLPILVARLCRNKSKEKRTPINEATIKTKLKMFNLPADMLCHIYEFDTFKYDGWNAVSSQFMKGGFIRKSLNIKIYLKREKWCARKFWTAKRLNLYPIKKEVYILKREWNCKNKSALYEYAYTLDSGRISRRIVKSGANPVSKWLKNIERFELTHPTLVSYLTEKRVFNVNFNSIFYKKKQTKKMTVNNNINISP